MARMQTKEPRQGLLRRLLSSKALLMIVFIVAIVVIMMYGTSGISGQVQSDQAQFLSDAVRRSAVQCYSLEGRFPENVSYLEVNYGLIIDRERYAVYYESMGDNILPQIRVVSLSK